MVENIDLKDLRSIDDILQLIERLKQGQDQFILNAGGQPKAALLSIEDLELLKSAKQNKQAALQKLFATMDAVHDRNKHIPEEQVYNDVAEAISAVRQQRQK